MLHKSHLDTQRTDTLSAVPDSLEQSIAEYVLTSDHIKERSKEIAKVREGMIPTERLEIMAVEAAERVRLSSSATTGERILGALGALSKRQATLVSHAMEIREDILKAQLANATRKLEAAMLVESTYLALFSINAGLQRSIGLLTTYTMLGDVQNSEWSKFDRASYRLETAARAHFESFGMRKDANGWIPEENYWAIKNAQNVLLRRGAVARRQASHREQQAIVASIPLMDCLDNAAISSVNGKVVIPCDLGGEALQRNARELLEQMNIFFSPQSDSATQIDAMLRSDDLTCSVERLAEVALEHIQNTQNKIRRCILNSLFPQIKGLQLLEELYPQG
jgi:hypothetical protein